MSDDTKTVSKVKKTKKDEPSLATTTTTTTVTATTNPATNLATNTATETSKPVKLKLSQLAKLKEVGESASRPEPKKSTTDPIEMLPAINSVAVLGQHQQLDELARLVADDSHSLLSHTYNPNNNIFILDYVIRRLSGQKATLGSLRLFTINWDIMMSKCPAKSMLRPSERDDYQYPIYEFPPDALPDSQQGYLIDFQKMRYKTYPIILSLVEYLISARSFVARRRKPLIICHHMEVCLMSYYYKFAQLLERYPDHYYWMLHGGTETPNLIRHKFMSMVQYYPVRLDLPPESNPASTVETGLLAQSPGTDVTPILRQPLVGLEFSVNGTTTAKTKDTTQIQSIIWDLTDRDLLKTLILAENITTPTGIILALPLCQILTEFIQGLKAIKHMNDVTACYRMAYKINTLGYSIARFGRTLTGILKWHRSTKGKFAPDFVVLAADKNWPRVIKLFADYEPGKYKDKNEQIPIFQNLMIDLARIQLGG